MSIIWIAVFVVVVATVCVVCEKRKHKAFKEEFPPISDAEFMARCKPGTNPTIALKVRRIVSNQLGVDYDRIYPSSRFVEDLGAE